MEIAINLNQVARLESDLSGEIKKLNTQYTAAWNVITNCPFSGAVRSMIISNLKQNAKVIQEETVILKKMKKALNSSISKYQNCEKSLINPSEVSNNKPKSNSNTVDVSEEKIKKSNNTYVTWKDFFKLIGGAGVIGNVISAAGSLFTGKDFVDSLLNAGGYITKLVKNFTSIANEKVFAKWKDYIYGGNNGFKDINMEHPFGSSFIKQAKELSFTGAKTVAEKVKVIASWAGHIFTVLKDAKQNYDEFNGFTERAIKETAIQSAVDIGIGAIATAGATWVATGVASAAAAAGFAAAAPVIGSAVAIAAGATVIAWGANSVCKWFTNKFCKNEDYKNRDLGEFVADLILD